MEVFVCAPGGSKFSNFVFPEGSVVRDIPLRFGQQRVVSPHDLYVNKDGRRACLDDDLQGGAIYHLVPRLPGGKGGFGSMLRALGAQIEKTTNREACRDLSGRRLRDVNHEKEMADWLKQQTEREAEKEQRRLERLQRKLMEPKHQFSDASYQQQCHDLSERLEDSVLKGLQAASGSQVTARLSPKRHASGQSEPPIKKLKKMGACFWSGVGELSSEDDDDSPSTSCAAAVTMTTQRVEPGPSSSMAATQPQEDVAVQKATPPEEVDVQEATPHQEEVEVQKDTPTQEDAAIQEDTPPQQEVEVQKDTPTQEDTPPQQEVEVQKDTPTQEDVTVQEDTPPQQEVKFQKDTPTQQDTPPQQEVEVQEATPHQVDAGAVSSCSSELQRGGGDGVTTVSVSSAKSVQELERLGLDVLKQELMSRGVKCGGTLSERAARLFAVRNLQMDQINPALLAKPTKSKRK
uniref:splicing regulator SDE2 n=1 Tax=Doryrhamphus excisus TaxID=161450 RepID=UPI0025AEC652|nr:splicing regulator SDE2 [Doryrhamphus excisus]